MREREREQRALSKHTRALIQLAPPPPPSSRDLPPILYLYIVWSMYVTRNVCECVCVSMSTHKNRLKPESAVGSRSADHNRALASSGMKLVLRTPMTSPKPGGVSTHSVQVWVLLRNDKSSHYSPSSWSSSSWSFLCLPWLLGYTHSHTHAGLVRCSSSLPQLFFSFSLLL